MDISIVVTTYNYDKYLPACIQSCIDQDSSGFDYEIIIIDDGSTDSTNVILEQAFPENVQAYRIENSGIEHASNYGFEKCSGDYIVRLDADDVLYPNYLSEIKKYTNQGYGFIYPNYDVIDDEGALISSVELPEYDPVEISSRGDFLATGTLVRADLIKSIGGYDCRKRNSGLENYELILDFIKANVVGYNVPEILFGYRRHCKNISTIKREEIIQNGKELFYRKNLGYFKTNQNHPYGLVIE